MHSSSLFTLSGSWHGPVNTGMCVFGLRPHMHAYAAHPLSVSSAILGGPAVQGLHWHPHWF